MATREATPYTFTEKKRIRKSFAKRASVLPVPFLSIVISSLWRR